MYVTLYQNHKSLKDKLFKTKGDIAVHIVVWLSAMIVPLFISPFYTQLNENDLASHIPSKIISDIVIAAFFYINFYKITPEWIEKKNNIKFAMIAFSVVIGLLFIEIILLRFISRLPLEASNNISFSQGRRPYFSRNLLSFPKILGILFYYILALVISSALAINNYQKEQQERQKQIEFEKLTAELEVLKLQISPHFLFNTLNNIRSLVRKKSENTEEVVLKLSNILRYMLYQSKANKVALSKEISHIKDYIDLQKLRMSEPEKVKLEIVGAIDDIQIEPLLFIPFVENAFKYGIHAKIASEIAFSIIVADNYLLFESRNEVFEITHDTDESSGLGLENVKKRLALYYPKQHELFIDDSNNRFVVKMKLPLSKNDTLDLG